LNRW